jgi:ribosome-associated protein
VSEPLRVSPRLTIPAAELAWRFSRSSGPGGQSVNTADTRVELSYDLRTSPSLPEPLRRRAQERLAGRLVAGVLTVVASEHRSQLRNREAAADRLVELLRDAVAPPAPPRRPTKPSRRARQRRLDGKRYRGELKQLRQRPPAG